MLNIKYQIPNVTFHLNGIYIFILINKKVSLTFSMFFSTLLSCFLVSLVPYGVQWVALAAPYQNEKI